MPQKPCRPHTKRPCRPRAHQWHIACCLALGLCGPDHVYPVLVIRACGRCGREEPCVGTQHTHAQRVRLTGVAP